MQKHVLSGAKACRSCRSRQKLSNEYLLAKIGVDTAENEPLKVPLIFKPWDLIFTEPPSSAEVPGSSPPIRFHSLSGELGGVVRRFREFVVAGLSGRAEGGRAELRALPLGGAVRDAFRENANCGDPVG